MRLPGLLVFFVFWVFPCFPRHEKSLCGTRPGLWREERFLHRQLLRKRPVGRIRPMAAQAPFAAADIGNLAILEDSDGVVARRNEFDLDRRTVIFTPTAASAARYRYEMREGGYDDGQASAGQLLAGLTDDDSRPIDLPFEFPYFGAGYRRVYVNSDGNLTFGTGDGSSNERSLGRLNAGPPRIAPLFDDLDPSHSSQGVRLLSENWRVVISWVSVPEWVEVGTGPAQTFQVRLYPDGRIEFAWNGAAPEAAVVGISPGGLNGSSALVSFATDASGDYAAAVAERFGANLEIDVTTAAQKFYQTHEDAYDYLVFFNDLGIDAGDTAVAYEMTVRNHRAGYGDGIVDVGGEYGSRARLQAVMNMGPLSQYPTNPKAVVPARGTTGDTPVSVIAHEAGHLFLAYASVRDANDQRARPMLGFQSAHWFFGFNSEASLLEGNRIQDAGPDRSPRFTTTGAVEGFSPLDQYLMGLRPAGEVEPDQAMFYVTGTPATFQRKLPQRGVTFDGGRRDVHIDELATVLGRRTPDYTVAQRRFRFAFVLIVPQGSQPTADTLAKLDGFRAAFEQFYRQATGNGAVADTALKLDLRLSLAPAAGVVTGRTASATASVETPPAAPLTIALERRNGVADAPASVTIPAGARSVGFTITGLREGVEELLATPSDGRYHVAAARVQVAAPAAVRIVPMGSNPLAVRVTDINELPYPGVKLTASVPGGEPVTAVTGENGAATFAGVVAGSAVRVSLDDQTGVTVMPSPARVVNAASWAPLLAPGALATITGTGLIGGGRAEAAAMPWPESLAGVRVLINGRPAPVTYASDAQVNFLIPPDLLPGTASLSVENGSGISAPVAITLSAIAPGIFANGFRRVGDALEIYCTGLGAVRGGDGLQQTVNTPTAFIGGRQVEVLYSGLAPGYEGLYQVNVGLPSELPAGPQPVMLSIAGVASNEMMW